MPVFEFVNNVGYASSEGLATWYVMEHASVGQHSLVENSTFWNNTTGIDLGYTHRTELRNLTVFHAPSTEAMLGLKRNAVTTDIIYNNLTVVGYRMGIHLPTRGNSVVNGGYFDNAIDIFIRTGSGRNALLTGFATPPEIAMVVDTNLTGMYASQFFGSDIVILDFGPFAGERLYYTQQAADGVPFLTPIEGLPLGYVGLTNQQLWDRYGVALGGVVAPSEAYTVPNITGLVGPSA
jgi:hypothetical protein